jgi:hypothetical protein
MRPNLIAGIALIILSFFLLVRGGSFTTQKDVVKIGDVKLTANEKQSIPPWVAYLGIAAGAGLLLAGTRKRA